MSASLPAAGRGLAAPPKPTEPLGSGPGAGWSSALPSAARAEPQRTAARARVPPCKHPGRRGGSKAVRDPGSTAGTRPWRGREERAGPPSRQPLLPGRCRHRTSCLAGGGWGRGKPPRLTEKPAEQFGFPEGAKCCFFSSSAEIQAALSWGFPPAGGRRDVCVRTEPAKRVGNNFCGQCQHRETTATSRSSSTVSETASPTAQLPQKGPGLSSSLPGALLLVQPWLRGQQGCRGLRDTRTAGGPR